MAASGRILFVSAAVGFAAAAFAGEIRYSAFCGGLDLAGDGYRVLGDMKRGRFSFRSADGKNEWLELSVSAAVNGVALAPFSFAGKETDAGRSAVYALSYTNASARAELAFRPQKVSLSIALLGKTDGPLRSITLCPGSRTDSDYVFDPSVGRQPYHEFPVDERRLIYPGLASPPPWMFSYRKEGRRGCWSAAFEPEVENINFDGVCHEPDPGGRRLGWTVRYPVCAALRKALAAPPLVLRFGDGDFFGALARHVADLKAEGKMRVPERKLPEWHKRTIACTWRYQRGNPKREKADESTCEAYVAALEKNGIDFGTLIIDDFWGGKHGIWEADPGKWRDLRGFIDRQHAKGRKVLLWVCTGAEGLPEDERQDGNWNLESAALRRRIRESARRMLSPEPGCYDADGVKFDFTSTSPADYAGAKDVGCGYLLKRFEILSEALLAVKPDAILDFQCCNPYFTHTLTMLRLNDYFGVPEHGFAEMSLRARIARICAPGALIDTDHVGFGTFTYRGGEEFFRRAHELGVPSLYLCEEDFDDAELMEILKSAYGAKKDR